MDVYEAFADPTRREIVAMLAASERSAGDISSRFEIAGPSVSRRLRVLRESGLISYRQQARNRGSTGWSRSLWTRCASG